MTLLSGLYVVLNIYTGRTDLCIGTTVAGRDDLQLEDIIGFFVNILPIRVDLAGDPDAGEIIRRVKIAALEAYEHQALPFEHIVSSLQLERDRSQISIVPIVARHHNVPGFSQRSWSGGAELQESITEAGTIAMDRVAKSELDLQFTGQGADLEVVVEYAADLFKASTIERMLQHHAQVLRQLTEEQDAAPSPEEFT